MVMLHFVNCLHLDDPEDLRKHVARRGISKPDSRIRKRKHDDCEYEEDTEVHIVLFCSSLCTRKADKEGVEMFFKQNNYFIYSHFLNYFI